jgi:protein-disulfide isomerase
MIDQGSRSRQERADYAAAIAFIVLCLVGVAVGGWHLWERVKASSTQAARGGSPPLRPTSRPTPPALPPAPVDIADTISLGRASARVALIEYSDFKCPYCGAFARDTWPDLRRQYVDTGKVRFIFRNLPLDRLHPLARQIAQTATCADRQGKFWSLHDLIFARQAQLDVTELERVVGAAGLDRGQLSTCLRSEAARRVGADEAAGQPLAVTGTPTFFVGLVQPDGRVLLKQRVAGAQPAERFHALLDQWLADLGPARP